ncbi:MAG: HlyD family efflux transporter periplasmic adaptor subunit [Phycisphaerales bacterium]
MIRWATIILAAAGLALAIYTVSTAQHEPPRVPLEAEPSVNPFQSGIAATGIVEPATRDVRIAAPEGALAMRVFVEVGDRVNAGDPLFELDPRPFTAQLAQARAARDSAAAALRRIEAEPRPEDIPPVEAQVRALQAEVADWTEQWERLSEAQRQTAATDYEVRRRWLALEGARARLEEASARLALLRAGAWGPDVEVARARLAEAEAGVAATQALLDRRTVRAPLGAHVLKRNIDAGEFVPADAATAAMILGDLSRLHIRARVDEEDLPLLVRGARGVARIRGQRAITAPLTMIRIEPLALPKTDLSGSTTERVDTRVVEVLFSVDAPEGLPLYPGQLVDVYIDASGARPPAAPPAAGPQGQPAAYR